MMETIVRAAAASPPHGRRRRQRSNMIEPKRRAFRIDGGDPVDAAHALAGAGLYEYGCRAVHRKRLPAGSATEDKSWYFAFTARRRDVPDPICAHPAPSPTHAMMQAILWEKRILRCTLDGAPFAADLTDVECTRTREAQIGALRGSRRADVRARAVRASDRRLNGRPLDVEIAVTDGARSYERAGDLTRAGRACLELSVARDERVEADPAQLEASLLAGLRAGAFSARWIVGPDGAKALVKTVNEVRVLLDHQQELAQDEFACARGELSSAGVLLAACDRAPSGPADAQGDAAALARLAAERGALLALVDARYRDRDATSLAWLIAERTMPSLREPRLRTRALRLAALRSELRVRFAPPRPGIMKRIAAFDRALHAPMSEAAARRAEAESLAAIGSASVRHGEERLERIAEYRRKLDELEAAGVRELLFPPGTSLRATIAYEYRLRFG
jgi:hypothetical protein